MKIKRLSGFTLTEMIITMLITAVLISMIFSVFQIVSKNYVVFSKKNDEINDIERLHNWLERDIERTTSLRAGYNSLLLTIAQDTVIYVFGDSTITRKSTRTDIFSISNKNFKASFRRQPVDTVKTASVADDVHFTILLKNEEIPQTFHKLYSSLDLITLTDAIDRYK